MLRDCPFCHTQPIEYDPRGGYAWTVECSNKDCVIKPATWDYGCDDTKVDDPKQAARDAWNGIAHKGSDAVGETLIPTMNLRFVEKSVPAPELHPDIEKIVRVLQQRFNRPSGGHVWQDVPFVETDENEGESN